MLAVNSAPLSLCKIFGAPKRRFQKSALKMILKISQTLDLEMTLTLLK
jgi:hypothetical protein